MEDFKKQFKDKMDKEDYQIYCDITGDCDLGLNIDDFQVYYPDEEE